MNIDIEFDENTILVVDDNPTNLGVIVDYLEDQEFEIITARDGEEGLEKAAYARPDIILLDIMMPGIDGFETCRLLKESELTNTIPVIFMTALASEEDKVRGFEMGAVDYITKPVQQREVLARVNTHLRIQEQSKQLKAQAEQLLALNASKDKFFSIVAHDLRGPFLPLLGNLELLADMADQFTTEEVKEMSVTSHRAAKRVADLLENLLQWSRIQMGRMEYLPERLNLSGIAQQTVELFGPIAQAKGISLQYDIEDGLKVYADDNMLRTVLRNFVSNALKFTNPQGTVTISARLTGKNIEISVADTGVGISEDALNKLFIIGIHNSTTGTAQEKGTGLGLIMCKEMVELNNGTVWIESIVGKGTTVKCTLPAC